MRDQQKKYERLAQELWVKLTGLYALEGSGKGPVWRSRCTCDGVKLVGRFILGVGKEAPSMLQFYIEDDLWERCEYAEDLAQAPEDMDRWWHEELEVLRRL